MIGDSPDVTDGTMINNTKFQIKAGSPLDFQIRPQSSIDQESSAATLREHRMEGGRLSQPILPRHQNMKK